MNARRRRRAARHGFTLLEVLLVVAILVILASVVTVSIVVIQANAYTSTAQVQIEAFEQALTAYRIDTGTYPGSLEELMETKQNSTNPKAKGPYLEEVPKDPWNNPYQYKLQDGPDGRPRPLITSFGPDGGQGGDDDISNAIVAQQ